MRTLLAVMVLVGCSPAATSTQPAPAPVSVAAAPAASASASAAPTFTAYFAEGQHVEPSEAEVPGPLPEVERAEALARAQVRVEDTPLARGQRLLGPCWLPLRHAYQELELRLEADQEPEPAMVDAALDLDRDNTPDFVLGMGAEVRTINYLLYVRRGDCGYFVGRIDSSAGISLEAGSSHGLRSLRAELPCEDGCCNAVLHYRFDGARYVVAYKTKRQVECGHGEGRPTLLDDDSPSGRKRPSLGF